MGEDAALRERGADMKKSVQALLLLMTGSSVAIATPASAITQSAQVKVTVVKPLSLTALQDMDFGTITLNGGTWSSAAVTMTRAGVFTCSNANLVCSGAPKVARYKVTGTNKQVVLISVPNVTLTNSLDPTQKLTLVPDTQSSLTLTSSGEPGMTFDIGGTLTFSSTTADGTYAGTMNVTVDYQ
jgi:hypothetical protein